MLHRNDAGNSRIPYRDPPVKLGDDIVEDDIVGNFRISKKRHPLTPRNSRIPKDEFRIPRDCFTSLAMTQGILEFLS